MAANTNTMPGVEPPPGVRSNFVDPPTHNGLIITVAVLAVAFSTFFMCLRIYTRRFINHKLWWDDCQWLSRSRGTVYTITDLKI